MSVSSVVAWWFMSCKTNKNFVCLERLHPVKFLSLRLIHTRRCSNNSSFWCKLYLTFTCVQEIQHLLRLKKYFRSGIFSRLIFSHFSFNKIFGVFESLSSIDWSMFWYSLRGRLIGEENLDDWKKSYGTVRLACKICGSFKLP